MNWAAVNNAASNKAALKDSTKIVQQKTVLHEHSATLNSVTVYSATLIVK